MTQKDMVSNMEVLSSVTDHQVRDMLVKVLGEEDVTIVFTGALSYYVREEAAFWLQSVMKVHVDPQITKRTNYLIVGSKPGSKLQKAQAKGIPIISEEEFYTLIQLKQKALGVK